ncbi:transglycosylase domain-containing protein [Nesterenkonia marinintestina]|uniref:transglycosylase domain-containing protein n=1 Tax=Nesterenkonia marinintestina TaxID=2979865 RepID=UPI0021C0C27A|nr:transglycosylase domain-containing protein [Nesterenkonia sp. GX14115]
MASSKSPLFDTATTVGKIMSFLGVSALCGVLAAGLIFPLAATGGATAAAGTEILEELPSELREEPLSVPSHVYDQEGNELATFYAENRTPVDIDEISDNMTNAIIAIEDERFYEHGGVDARGLGRAVVHNVTSDSQQGASTITQQYVNNVMINADFLRGEDRLTISGSKTYADKLREMKLAVAAEEDMTKDEILEGYLNIVLFGGRNYGVEAAAQYYWGIPASELNPAQSATLAGMVQNPNGYNPENNPESAESRRDVVLGAMLRNDYLSQEEYDEAIDSSLDLDVQPEPSGCVAAESAPYFCDYVRRAILADDTFGPDQESRDQLLNRGGLEITTTLDPELQDAAQSEVEDTMAPGSVSGAAATLVTVEPGSGDIKAMAQNTEYSPEEGEGRTELNFNVDAAFGGGNGFQGGSTLKPYVAAAWLESGHSMYEIVDAGRDEFAQGSQFQASCLPNGAATVLDDGGWSINNVMDNSKRPMTADFGLFWSVNTATVNMAYELDLCDIADLTTRLGVKQAGDGAELNPQNPSFVLGSENLSPMTQASAYAAFAADGEYCRPRAISEVTDANGNEYDVSGPQCEEAMEADSVAQLNETMTNIADYNAQDSGSSFDFPVGGKTGTNNEQSSTWFIGYSKGLSTASWVGSYADMTSLNNRPINGQVHDEVYGSTIAMPMWVDYMNRIAGDYSTDDFRSPDDSPFQNPDSTDRYMGGNGREGGNTPENAQADDGSGDDAGEDGGEGGMPEGDADGGTP